jgi:hypothetical protein
MNKLQIQEGKLLHYLTFKEKIGDVIDMNLNYLPKIVVVALLCLQDTKELQIIHQTII